jgi:hypothetical protein
MIDCDLFEEELDLPEELGATYKINALNVDPIEEIKPENCKSMKEVFTRFSLIDAFALKVLTADCASAQTQSKQDLLIAESFRVIRLNTLALQQNLQSIPPIK